MAWDPVASYRRDDLSTYAALVAGLAAFVLGYAILLVANTSRTVDLPESMAFEVTAPDGLQVIGWLFYSAHQVAIEASTMGYAVVLPLQRLPSWEQWYVLVPIVSLFVAGFLLARVSNSPDVAAGFSSGASVGVGYLPLAVLGYVFVSHTTTTPIGPVTVRPTLLGSVLLVGIAYPVLFGGIGGAVGARFAD